MTAALHAELRRMFSTKLWWGLLIPVVAISTVVNAFGVLFSDLAVEATGDTEAVSLLLASLAYTLTLTSVFGAVVGIVSAGGEFRHRTITTTYLTSSGRAVVLVAKMAVSALVGVLYGASAALVGVLTGLLSRTSTLPDGVVLLQVAAIGAAVCGLWAALGAGLGLATGNQVGALVGALVYLLVGELLVSTLLNESDNEAVAGLTPYLPGNAGDVALLDVPAAELAGPAGAVEIVQVLAGVTHPPAWWVALLVLAVWTAVAGSVAAALTHHRDIT